MIVRSEDIRVRSGKGSFLAYVASPEKRNSVAVVVLQEIFGVNANIRAIVDGFAAAGYTAVAPDLYWRQCAGITLDPTSEADREHAMKLMEGLDRDQAVADGAAALDNLRERCPDLSKSAAVGYCFGGGVAYLMAARGIVDAGISYYGTGLQDMLAEMNALQGRLLIHLAADDHLCPPVAQQAITQAAAKAGGTVSVSIYPGVGHAFARAGGATFNREAADKANSQTMALLGALTPST